MRMTHPTTIGKGTLVKSPSSLSLQPIHFCILLLALPIAIASTSEPAHGEQYQLSLIEGSVITVDVNEQDIVWTDVQATGEMTKRKLAFSDIQNLVLSFSPAGEQVAEIRRLLTQLESPEYIERESSEEKLSAPEIGGQFKSLIKTQVNHKKYEVRYRINRILERLDAESQQTDNEFDKLTLKNGTKFEGDAGNFVLNCSYRGLELKLERADIRMVSQPGTSKSAASPPDVQVNLFHDHVGNFYQPTQTTVSFEESPNGAELGKYADVTELYSPLGLLLGAEKKGTVVVSGFPFRFSGMPPSKNSICVYESLDSYKKRFKGIMEFKFCMPNQRGVPAGVHEIGMFVGRVNHSRDFILEAYNADGQLLAGVEASDRPCIFVGVKSSEPIAKLRLLSNPYLFRIGRIIDDDYAVDDICFSPPVPLVDPVVSEPGVLRLRNGDLLKLNQIEELDTDFISFQFKEKSKLRIDTDQIEAIRFNRERSNVSRSGWMATLPDRSVLRVEPGATFNSQLMPHLQFKPEELMAVWSSRNKPRFPIVGDFQKGKNVMVFPTCRIASDTVEFSSNGYKWGTQQKIEQPILFTDDEEDDDEDPTPDIEEVDYNKTGTEDVPTLWLRSPRSRKPDTGLLRLTDGQQLVLGGESGFKLEKVGLKTVIVSATGKPTEIPTERILSIQFPPKQ